MNLILACRGPSSEVMFMLGCLVVMWMASRFLALANGILIARRASPNRWPHILFFVAYVTVGFAWWYVPKAIWVNKDSIILTYALVVPNLIVGHFACLAFAAWRRRRLRRRRSAVSSVAITEPH